ncbi:hypothetical protein ADUPG1_010469 [Aduncisulcus paluster]|uniref:Uncharacterized protein n=1 Tax=Aduncisulcus paluster TaxID=2918883 RepID=A0ABQ5JS05_9EUKA|nr:hypothetical protein ADUPG1_010469 [Aduncisulcus paluster]
MSVMAASLRLISKEQALDRLEAFFRYSGIEDSKHISSYLVDEVLFKKKPPVPSDSSPIPSDILQVISDSAMPQPLDQTPSLVGLPIVIPPPSGVIEKPTQLPMFSSTSIQPSSITFPVIANDISIRDTVPSGPVSTICPCPTCKSISDPFQGII